MKRSSFLAGLLAIVLVVASHAIAAPPVAPTPVPEPQKTLLLLHMNELTPAAKAWASYRRSNQGGVWNVILHSITPSDDANAQRSAVQATIRSTWEDVKSHGADNFAVLLLGDAEVNSSVGIPAWYFPQHDSVMRSHDGRNDSFASDHPYQLQDDADELPDYPLGRIPARSVDEAMHVLELIIAYESPPSLESLLDEGRSRISYTAGEGRFGPMDGVLEELFKMMVDRMVPDAFDLSMIYAKSSSIYCPPPSKLTESVLDQLINGGLLFNYIGHGFETGFDSLYWQMKKYPILNVRDLQRQTGEENNNRLRPIAFLSCCSAGCYDMKGGERSMSEEILFNPNVGAIGVIAGSRITHPYANTVMQMNISKSMLVDREPTIGLLDLRADQSMLKRTALDRQIDALASPIARSGKWESSLRELREMHIKLYNLIGDPATRIAYPSARIANFQYKNNIITGEIPNLEDGRITITLETARTSMVNAADVKLPEGDNDPELEAKAAHNAAIVNNRVVLRLAAIVKDGAFAIELPEPMPSDVRIIRAHAVGISASGEPINAITAIRVLP